MATRQIRFRDDLILRKKSKKVNAITPFILTLLDDMADTMYEANGVGIAAVQVGALRRVVIVDVGEGKTELINPEIIKEEGEQSGKEGCLSVPEMTGIVERPQKVTVKALDRDGKEIIIEAEDYLAVAMCHEIDHLDGILFTDKAIVSEYIDG